MKRKALIFVFVFALLAMGLGGCGSNEPGTLEGRVFQADNGQPIPSATVTIFLLTKMEQDNKVDVFTKATVLQTVDVDENGEFSVTLRPIKYKFEVEALGFEPTGAVIQVKPERTITQDFELTPLSP